MAKYIYLNGHINTIQPYYVMYNGQRYNAAHFNGNIVFGKFDEVEPTVPPTEPPTEPPTIPPTPDPVTKYTPFFVENISNINGETLNIEKTHEEAPTFDIEYSLDEETWTLLGSTNNNNQNRLTLNVEYGQKIFLRSRTNAWAVQPTTYAVRAVTITGVSKVGGNIMSLIYKDDFSEKTNFGSTSYNFYQLFAHPTLATNNILIDATYLILPATTLTPYCYCAMFNGCTNLRTTPALPATTLDEDCYNAMFSGCTSLTTTPSLPATTLTYECYWAMFQGCTSLTTITNLPATTLGERCYVEMFRGCTALTTAPRISGTLALSCCKEMFRGCTALTTAPDLPATTLAQYCYDGMFHSCTALTTAPELPATTLVYGCYEYMFRGCTNLNNIKCLAVYDVSTNRTNLWIQNVSATGTFYKAAGVTWPTGTSGIPTGWTVVEV